MEFLSNNKVGSLIFILFALTIPNLSLFKNNTFTHLIGLSSLFVLLFIFTKNLYFSAGVTLIYTIMFFSMYEQFRPSMERTSLKKEYNEYQKQKSEKELKFQESRGPEKLYPFI